MKGLVYFKEDGSLEVDWDGFKGWAVKRPTRKHSIKNKQGGSCSFDGEDYIRYSRDPKKLGIVVIDVLAKVYVFFSKQVLEKYPPESKEQHGIINSWKVYSNLKTIIELECLEMIPFGKLEAQIPKGPAADVRSKFGL